MVEDPESGIPPARTLLTRSAQCLLEKEYVQYQEQATAEALEKSLADPVADPLAGAHHQQCDQAWPSIRSGCRSTGVQPAQPQTLPGPEHYRAGGCKARSQFP